MKRLLCPLLALVLFSGIVSQAEAQYVFTPLENLNPLAVGAGPLGINNLGQIVGDDLKTGQGFLLGGPGYSNYSTIGPPGYFSHAWGINDTGQIVGDYQRGRLFYAYLYSGGAYSHVVLPGIGVAEYANGINNAGQIVGSYGGFQHGYVLSGGTYTTFDIPGSTSIFPSKINNTDQIVGFYGTGPLTGHGFLLSGSSVTTLDVPGATSTAASGINDAGEIVGNYVVGGVSHGFMWSGGIFTTLDGPGSTFAGLNDINDAGQIVGVYRDAAGVSHSFLASPVPEPSALLLLSIAGMFFISSGLLGTVGGILP